MAFQSVWYYTDLPEKVVDLIEEDIAENERLWKEENDETLNPPDNNQAGEMRGAGITGAGISADIGGAEDIVEPDAGEDGGTGDSPTSITDPEPQPTAADPSAET